MPLQVTDISQLSTATIDEVEAALIAMIRVHLPTADLSRGSVLHSLLIRPASLFHTINRTNILRLQNSMSLSKILANPEAADADAVDAVLSNFLLARRSGRAASGRIRIVLSSLRYTPIADAVVFTAGDQTFRPIQSYSGVTSSAAVLSTSDRLITPYGSSQYSFTIEVTAETAGSGGNVPKGTMFSTSSTIATLVQLVAASDFDGGDDEQTNTELLEELSNGVATRTAAGRDSLEAMLKAAFTSIRDVSVVGAGDPEMLRDGHLAFGVKSGGKVDVYVRTRDCPLTETLTVTAALTDVDNKVWSASLTRDDLPGAYRVLAVRNAAGLGCTLASFSTGLDLTEIDGVDFTPRITDAQEGAFSRYQTLFFSFTDETTASSLAVNATASFEIDVIHMPEIDVIHDWLSDRTRRPPSGDYLVKASVPCLVGVGLTIVQGPGDPDVDEDAVTAAVVAAVNDTDQRLERLPASRIIEAVQATLPPRTRLQLPIELRGVVYGPNGQDYWQFNSLELVAPDMPQYQVSPRTVAFCTTTTGVSVSVLPPDQRGV
jgi:hypothetical protein